MPKNLGFLLSISVWFTLNGFCSGRFVVEKNSLQVTSPDSLKDVYECAIGNFGVPQYGGTMVGAVVYPKANQKACHSFSKFDISFKSKPGGMPVFVLAERGDCYFPLKVWMAQNGGAAAILVADDRIEPLITMDTPLEDEARGDYHQDITIPSALISKSLGDNIKKALNNGDMVQINLEWREALPHPDEYDNTNDECGPKCENQIEFVKTFKGVPQILERKRDTWIQKLGQSWRNTCLWIIKGRFPITFLMEMFETDIGQGKGTKCYPHNNNCIENHIDRI